MIKNEKLRKTLRGLSVLFLVWSVFLFGQDAFSTSNHQQENKNLTDIKENISEEIIDTTGTPPEEVKPEDIMGSQAFYDNLRAANSDYIGWIYLPGLKIDHPVVAAPNNSYYLNHGFYKAYNMYGTIFVDYRNTELFLEPHLVIYGHHMKNKSMFSYLDTLRTKSNYSANKIIEIYTSEGLKKYIIFSVHSVDATTTSLSLPYEADVQTLIESYTKKALYKTGVDTSKATQILTLVTCTLAVTNGRLFVHAIPYND
jgi:sortase B